MVIRKEIMEQLVVDYGEDTVKHVERMTTANQQYYGYRKLCIFVREWNRITTKLKKMYGKKLADIVITPVITDRAEE